MRKAVVFWVALFAATGCGGAEVKVGAKTGGDGEHMGRIDSNSRCELGDGMREALVDLNQDKNPDVRKVYAQRGEGEVLVCREADLNFDGLKDIFYYFDEDGAPKRDEVDLDYDGVIDIVSTYASGKVVKQELDTNSDAQIDRVRFLEDGLPSAPGGGHGRGTARSTTGSTTRRASSSAWEWTRTVTAGRTTGNRGRARRGRRGRGGRGPKREKATRGRPQRRRSPSSLPA